MDDDPLLTPKELSDRVGVSINLVRKLMRNGQLEFIEYSKKIRKIRLSSWKAYELKMTRNAPISR